MSQLVVAELIAQVCEPRHDKTNKTAVRPAKTQISLGIRPVWSESSLAAWRKLGSLATHWAQSEDSDQTGRMPRLIWVFAGRTVTLFVLSCCSYSDQCEQWYLTKTMHELPSHHTWIETNTMKLVCAQSSASQNLCQVLSYAFRTSDVTTR